MAVSTTERINFGTGSAWETPAGATSPTRIANLTDITVDFKLDLKEAFGELRYPIAVADGHGTIDISAKHYTIDPTLIATAAGGTVSTGATAPQAVDEAYQAPASTPFTVTLNNGASGKLVAGTLVVFGTPTVSGVLVPTVYSIVAAGSEVAGKSYSVNTATGVLTFAAADAATPFQASYSFTSTLGTRVTVSNSFQNSQKPMTLVAVKRDSSVDGATAALVYTFFAVRVAGYKPDHKEGDFTEYERTYKAYANAAGMVFQVDFVNY